MLAGIEYDHGFDDEDNVPVQLEKVDPDAGVAVRVIAAPELYLPDEQPMEFDGEADTLEPPGPLMSDRE